ncbi:MAG: hypothetical protein ABH843_04945 [Candidatus Omnitrophota bacterium]
MKRFLIELLVILLIIALAMAGSGFYMPQLLSVLIGKRLGAQVEIAKAFITVKGVVAASGISIVSENGLGCTVADAIIELRGESFITLVKDRRLYIPLDLKNIRLQKPGSAAVSSITDALGFTQLSDILFDSAEGRLYFKNREVVLKSIKAKGEDIELSIDGTITNDDHINCSFNILLSDKLLSLMSESTRKFFFKQGENWSKVELYLSGDINRPGINFATPRFKLTVR